MGDPENALHLFLNGFAARDLAEGLPSFDECTPLATIREAVERKNSCVIGIREGGLLTGWMTREEVLAGSEPFDYRRIESASVIGDDLSLDQVVKQLDVFPCLFVRSYGQVNGVIRREDLLKPAMRMWLFGLVTISELRVTEKIEEHCPEGSWEKYLSPGRLAKGRGLQHERHSRGQQVSLLECLQFADKGQIVARDEGLRNETRFSSRKEVEKFVRGLQDLRNNLAHSQDLLGDWEIIQNLAGNVHVIVVGRAERCSARE